MAHRQQDESRRPLGVYWALFFGLASFSLSPILVRLAAEGPALAIVSWRTLIAAAALAPFAFVHSRKEIQSFTRRDFLLTGGAGILLGLHFVMWTESLYHTTVASASVLVTTSPIFLAVLGFIFLKERLSIGVNAAIVLAVIGAALLGLGDIGNGEEGDARLLGNSMALAASLLFSVYLLFGRVVRQSTSWLAYVFPLYTVTAATVLVTAFLLDTPLLGYSAGFYALCAGMAFGPQIVGHGSFNYGIRYIPAAILGVISLVEPVGASVLAYVLFEEVPTTMSLIGMLVTLSAIAFAIVHRSRNRVDVAVRTD
jgi:drug/metabolite transporter (DMT)-like permease